MDQLQHGRILIATAAEAFFRQPIRTKIYSHLRQSAEGLPNLNYTNFTGDLRTLILREFIASGTGVQTTATNGSTYEAPGFTYNRTEGDMLRFELVSVPEPGTMLLASLAAACGGGGVWWRKRKTAKNQAEPEPQAEV